MNTIRFKIDDPPARVQIGRQGENKATQIIIDCSPLVSAYGTGTATIIHRSNGSVFPAVTEQDGDMVRWTITAADTACAGLGEAEIRWSINDVLAKSVLICTKVDASINDDVGPVPGPFESWIQELTQLGAESTSNAAAAAQSATQAGESAAAAAQSAENAAVQFDRVQNAGNAAVSDVQAAQNTAEESIGEMIVQANNAAQRASESSSDAAQSAADAAEQFERVESAGNTAIENIQTAQHAAESSMNALVDQAQSAADAAAGSASDAAIAAENSANAAQRAEDIAAEINNEIEQIAGAFTIEWTENGYISKYDGSVNYESGSSYSDFVQVSPGDRLVIKNTMTSDTVWNAYYDAEKQFISSFDTTTGTITVPDNAYYFRLSKHTGADLNIIRGNINDKIDAISAPQDTVYANGADYGEVGIWNDGNPNHEDRMYRFVTLSGNRNRISIANADDQIVGVTTNRTGFVGNARGYDKNDYRMCVVGIIGIVPVKTDDYTIVAGDRVMSGTGGYAVKSDNNLGYRVISVLDEGLLEIVVSVNTDMIQRIKTDMTGVETDITQLKESLIELNSAISDKLDKPSIKFTMDDVAVAGSQYYIGQQSDVSIVLPDDAEIGQIISVSWYNGASAATLSITGTMLDFDYTPSANTRSEINALWDGTYWAVLGNEMAVVSDA